MSDSAKLAYLLSTCHKLSSAMFTTMIKQYENSKTLATRHYYTLHINLYENLHPDNFYVRDVYCKFSDSKDAILIEALQYHNHQVLNEEEMKLIYKNLMDSNIKLDAYQIVSIYCIATLIKLYRNQGFKYICIPVVINYGRDSHLLHQTALIIDISDYNCKMIYYEPYGNYSKYGKSYKNAVKTLLNCFNGFECFVNGVNYTTYHDIFGRYKKGIQQMMIEKNNGNSTIFQAKLNKVLDELKELFPNIDFKKTYDKSNAVDTDDKTVLILGVLSNTDRLNIESLNQEQRQRYLMLFHKLLAQYCCFNSKTCVSITIVELNDFFKFSQESNYNMIEIKKKVDEMYSHYDIPYPNEVLMTKIYKMVDLFRYSKKIKNIIALAERPTDICKKI